MIRKRHFFSFSAFLAISPFPLLLVSAQDVVPAPCPPGRFTNDTINCYMCPPDSYCQGGVLSQCPTYSTSLEGSSLVEHCQCQTNSFLDNGACMCSNGYVRGRPGLEDECSLCPAGFWCPEQNTVRVCTDNGLSLAGSFRAENCTLCGDGCGKKSQKYKKCPLTMKLCSISMARPWRTAKAA
jgi:hypothetical protein